MYMLFLIEKRAHVEHLFVVVLIKPDNIFVLFILPTATFHTKQKSL